MATVTVATLLFIVGSAGASPTEAESQERGLIVPKRSMVDIIQAVGRVIRKAAGKPLGTIEIPVFNDESEDADHEMDSRQFHFGACGPGRETYGAVTPSSRFTSLVVLPRVSWIRVTNGSPL